MNLNEILTRAPKKSFPKNIKPMMATLVASPFSDPDFFYEVKWDGYRAITEVEERKVRMYSRNNITFNERFPSIVKSFEGFKKDVVFDGEVVVVDEQGRSSFQLLQDYQLGSGGRLLYYLFDILYFDGHDLMSLPLFERKKILSQVLPGASNIRLSEHIEEAGEAFFEAAKKENLEGVIAKNKNSPYQPGKRGNAWQKFKILMMQEAVIVGFTKPRGSRRGFGSLILGVYENDRLVYIGHSGGGFSEKDIDFMMGKMTPLIIRESPFEGLPKSNEPVTWVRPELVCEVKFQEWTKEGSMRQPVFLGLREDKTPKEVKREVVGGKS